MPFCNIRLVAEKPTNPLLPNELKTLGDHIRAVRLNRGLIQKDVADVLGVSERTLLCWEKNYHEPEIYYYPCIMDFLGYCPYQPATTVGDFLRTFRIVRLGWSQEKMAREIGVDPSTLSNIEDNRGNRIFKKTKERIGTFLQVYDTTLPKLSVDMNIWPISP